MIMCVMLDELKIEAEASFKKHCNNPLLNACTLEPL